MSRSRSLSHVTATCIDAGLDDGLKNDFSQAQSGRECRVKTENNYIQLVVDSERAILKGIVGCIISILARAAPCCDDNNTSDVPNSTTAMQMFRQHRSMLDSRPGDTSDMQAVDFSLVPASETRSTGIISCTTPRLLVQKKLSPAPPFLPSTYVPFISCHPWRCASQTIPFGPIWRSYALRGRLSRF